ncbi:MAG: hypothetical protein HFH62_06815 [Lachnospiraceae bacterium]|nr:hypothetical protein [Lachnospiraceae bacterium]
MCGTKRTDFNSERKNAAVDMVRKTMLNKTEKYTKQDIRELCMAFGINSIEEALRKIVKVEEVIREGLRKGKYYVHLQ